MLVQLLGQCLAHSRGSINDRDYDDDNVGT